VLLHGFDNTLYTKIETNELRKTMNIPLDAFVFVNLNRNQPRKRYDILIMAFVELIVKHPNLPLYLLCICDKGEKGGWWLFEIYQRELLLRNASIDTFAARLMLTSSDMKFSDDQINSLYNIGNVGINTADGEGWGLCNFEQMGLGIPQVVPNVGGFKEYCNSSNSVLVEPRYRYYHANSVSPVGGETRSLDSHDVFRGMEEYALNRDKLKKHGEEAKKTVLTYTWARAVETLVKRLKQAQEDMDSDS
jgi:glycosyltransferase involved in cell wall biosynthesis